MVYVTLDNSIVDVLFVLQPEGGFFPLVLMQPWGIILNKWFYTNNDWLFFLLAKKVKIQLNEIIDPNYFGKLKKLFYNKLQPALEIYNKDLLESSIIFKY